jgi:DNA-binding MarR family transcriptional regulator
VSSKGKVPKSEGSGYADMELGALEHNVGFHMRKAFLAAQGSFLRATGVKLMTGQYSVMEIIANNPGRTQSAIANTAGLDRSSLVPILNQFEKSGLIEREAVLTDKRAYAVTLTDKGLEELADLREKIEQMEKIFMKGLGARNHQQLINLLRKFLGTL